MGKNVKFYLFQTSYVKHLPFTGSVLGVGNAVPPSRIFMLLEYCLYKIKKKIVGLLVILTKSSTWCYITE